jgi:hypothetical protein
MSVNGRSAPLLLLGALAILLAILGGACGSATLKTNGGAAGTAGAGGLAGRAGAGGAGVGGAAVSGGACVLDSTQVDNCILQ